MESIHVRQRLRPLRHAFVVNEADLEGAARAASINAALWGGVYNPIVPVKPAEDRHGLVAEFDPDILVNFTGADLPADLAARYEHRIVGMEDLVDTDDRTKRRRLALGFNILPILRHVHDTEVRLSPDPTRAAVILPEEAAGWPEFITFAYGAFGRIPESDVSFEEMYRRALRSRDVALPDLTPPPDYENILLPLEFTGYGLRRYGGFGSFSSHIVFIGDHRSVTDLVEFWNIRATGRTTVFVPVAAFRSFESLIRIVVTEGRYPINQQVENSADVQKGPSVSDQHFEEACKWIGTLDVGSFSARTWRPKFGHKIEHYIGDIHVAELEAAGGDEISILQDGRMTPVKMISPTYLDDEQGRRGLQSWSVEISMLGGYRDADFMFSFPNEASVEKVVCRSVMGMPDACRLGHRGIVMIQQGLNPATLYLAPVRTKDVFQALFREASLVCEPSQPGHYAEQIVAKMGSLQDCTVFKIRGVRDILDRLGNGSTLTKGNMHQIVMSTNADEQGINWRSELYEDLPLGYKHRRPLDFGIIFDVLLEKRIIRPGFSFRCANCFKEDWYHVSEFAEEYTCRFCFTPQRVNFGSVRDWQYKADGLFRIPDSAQGSVAVIVSLWRLEERSFSEHGRYLTSQNVVASDTKKRYEIDYAYLVMSRFETSYDLVLGQATRFSDFTDDDMQKMSELADRFLQKPYLAFSTLRDRYSDADKARLQGLRAKGYRVIAFTREELDPYYLFARYALAPDTYSVGLDELSKKTIHLNIA